jgi:DNA-directed RNA polymerase specialized sigma24 family protein
MTAGTEKMIQRELRERITASILDLLEHLPETQRNIFISKHYHGVPEEEIASRMKCSMAEVEDALRQVNFTLVERAGSVLA